ncbi:MAG: O-antigen ligase family protein [Syntrophobacteraceae bacterium]
METVKAGLVIVVGIFFIMAFFQFPKHVFLLYILIKPFVDRFAESGASVGGGVTLGYNYIAALVVPPMSLIYVLVMRRNLFSLPHKSLLLVFMVLNIVSFLVEGNYSVNVAGYFLRVILPLLLFFTIPFILSEREDILKFIRYSAISGIFPCAMAVLQKMGLIAQNRVAEGLGSTVYDRATGGYADSFSLALPIIIAIFCLYFLLQYTTGTKDKRIYVYWFLLVVDLVCLVFTYHRMSFIVVALVSALWSLINRRYAVILMGAGLIIVSLPFLVRFVPDFFGDLYVTKQIHGGVMEAPKEELASAALHGRGWVWRMFLDKFDHSTPLEQIIGIEMAGRAPHNDYLRVLITNGVFGLGVYLSLLFALGLRLRRAYLYFSGEGDSFMSQFALTSLFFFIFYVLGSTTLAISLLSSLTWYLWVFVGITYFQMSKSRQASTLHQEVAYPENP